MSTQTSFSHAIRVGLAAVLMALPVAAQEYRATITGTVVDPSGAAVPNVQVEARNLETSAVTNARTNEAGVYTIPFLLPGTYDLSASSAGFKQAVRKGSNSMRATRSNPI